MCQWLTVTVVKHDAGVFSAQLQGHSLQVTFSCCFFDQLSDLHNLKNDFSFCHTSVTDQRSMISGQQLNMEFSFRKLFFLFFRPPHCYPGLKKLFSLKHKTVFCLDQDEKTNLGWTSEGHFVHVHVSGDGCSCFRPEPWKDVDHTRRESCLVMWQR